MSSLTPTRIPGGEPVTLDKAVASAYAAALALGIYLSTLTFAVRWLLFSDDGWHRRKVINWPMVFVTAFICVSTVAFSALGLKGKMDAVLFLMTDPGMKYKDPMWMNVCKCMFANSVALAADLVLMYRCYVVYGNSLSVIAFPCLLWVGGVVCTILQMYLQIVHVNNPNLGPYVWAQVNMDIGPGIVLIPFWGSTTLLNMYCTFMLLRRIGRAARESSTSSVGDQFRFVARTIAESGVIYMSTSLAHFAIWFTYHNLAVNIISVLNVPLIGIAFNLILIRAAHRRMRGFGDQTREEDLTSINFNHGTTVTLDIRPEHKEIEAEHSGSASLASMDRA